MMNLANIYEITNLAVIAPIQPAIAVTEGPRKYPKRIHSEYLLLWVLKAGCTEQKVFSCQGQSVAII